MCVEKTPWEQVIEFHGHTCPEIAIGYRISQIAERELRTPQSSESELIVISESRSCVVDAFQVINQATIGNGKLIVKDLGQQVFFFHVTDSEYTMRISVSPTILSLLNEDVSNLSTREKQNKTLESIRFILTVEEEKFCDLQKVPMTLSKNS